MYLVLTILGLVCLITFIPVILMFMRTLMPESSFKNIIIYSVLFLFAFIIFLIVNFMDISLVRDHKDRIKNIGPKVLTGLIISFAFISLCLAGDRFPGIIGLVTTILSTFLSKESIEKYIYPIYASFTLIIGTSLMFLLDIFT